MGDKTHLGKRPKIPEDSEVDFKRVLYSLSLVKDESCEKRVDFCFVLWKHIGRATGVSLLSSGQSGAFGGVDDFQAKKS